LGAGAGRGDINPSLLRPALCPGAEGWLFGPAVSGDVAFNQLTYSVQAYIRDVETVAAENEISLAAQDRPSLGAAAGAVVVGDNSGIGGSLAYNGQDAVTRAYTQDTSLQAARLVIDADAVDTVSSFSRGSSGANLVLSVAGSVNFHNVSTTAEAALGARTIAPIPVIVLEADGTLRSRSSAGAASREAVGVGAFGAALDLGSLGNAAYAYIGDDASVDTDQDVQVNADTYEDIVSVVAATSALRNGQDNRLYLNNGTATPFPGVWGHNVGGDQAITSDVALGDIDGDGDVDLVTGSFGQFNRRYLNDGSGSFEDGQDIHGLFNILDSVLHLKKPAIDTNALVPDLTLAIALADVDGDGKLDVIAGNFGQPSRIYWNDGDGTFLPGAALGPVSGLAISPTSIKIEVKPEDWQDNRTAADLVLDLQTKIDEQIEKQLPSEVFGAPDLVRVELAPDGRVVFVSDYVIVDATKAEEAVAGARRDGVLQTLTGAPLSLTFGDDGRPVEVSINPADTWGNATAEDLRGQLQAWVGAAIPGVGVQIDPTGRIVFVLAGHTLDAASAESMIAEARRAGWLQTENDEPLKLSLPLSDPNKTTSIAVADVDGDGDLDIIAGNFGEPNRCYLNRGGRHFDYGHDIGVRTVELSIDPAETSSFQTADDLVGWLQEEIDAAIGAPDIVQVELDADGRIVLASSTCVISAAEAEDALAAARRDAGRLETEGGIPLALSFDLVDADWTTALATADLNQDGWVDLVVGNVGFDLANLIEKGVLRLTDFAQDTLIRIAGLVDAGIVSLLDLVEQGLIDRFGFDPSTPITIEDIIAASIAGLADLAHEGLLNVANFADLSISAAALLASELVTSAELTAKNLVDQENNVSLHDLVDSGIVWLEELIGDGFVGLGDLNVPDVTLGDLLDAQIVDLKELVRQGLVEVANLLVSQVNLRELIESGIASLTEAAAAKLLDITKLDPQKVDFYKVLDLAVGAPAKIYFNDGQGAFLPAVPLSQDRFVTRSLAIGDVDENGDLDIVVGNADAGCRLYQNSGDGTFAAGGTTVSEIARLVVDIVLEDMNGDGHLDLVTASLGLTKRLYLGDGTGGFGSGSDISSDTNVTSSIAAGDVDGDGDLDLVAGDSSFAIAASVSRFDVAINSKAYIGAGAVVKTDGSVSVSAMDAAGVTALAGASVTSNLSSFGASVASPNIKRDLEAYVLGHVQPALGSGFTTPQGLFVTAWAYDLLVTYAQGSGVAENLGAEVSASVPRMDSRVEASIGAGANVVISRKEGETQDLGVRVVAEHYTDSLGVAGVFAGSLHQGLGAAGDAKLFTKRVLAHISGAASISVPNDVVVKAISHETPPFPCSLVAGTGIGIELGIAGSLAFMKLDKMTYAYIEGATVLASGNVVVTADSRTEYAPLTGADALGVLGGIGFSGSLLMKSDDTRVYITADAEVNALAQAGVISVYTGEKNSLGARLTRDVKGVVVSATNADVVIPHARGGAAALGVSVAGSAAAVITDNHVAAYITGGALVNQGDAGALPDQCVSLFAWDDTVIIGVEEDLSTASLEMAIDATFNLADLAKNTEAYVGSGAKVGANGDVEIKADSTEDVRSIGGVDPGCALAAGGFVGAVHKIGGTTRAFTEPGSEVTADNQVAVLAHTNSEVAVLAYFDAYWLNLLDASAMYTEAKIGGATQASVGGTVRAGTLAVSSSLTSRVFARASLTSSILGTLAYAKPTAKLEREGEAYLGEGSNVTVSGALTVEAVSTNEVNTMIMREPSLTGEGFLSVDVMQPRAEIAGATRAFVGEGAALEADTCQVRAHAENAANVTLEFVESAPLDFDYGELVVEIDHEVEAYVGPRAGIAPNEALTGSITTRNGPVVVNATSTNTASTDDVQFVQLVVLSFYGLFVNGSPLSFIGFSWVAVNLGRSTVAVKGSTTAYVGGHFTINANGLDVSATAENSAIASTISVELSAVSVEWPIKTDQPVSATTHVVDTHVEPLADIIVNGGPLTLSAQSTNLAEAGKIEFGISLVNVEKTETWVEIGGATRAFIGEGATVNAPGLDLTAYAENTADAGTLALGATGVAVKLAHTLARTQHVTEAYIGPREGTAPQAGLSGSITVNGGLVNLHASSVNTASIDEVSVEIPVIQVNVARPEVTTGGSTLAYLGGNLTIDALAVTATATADDTASCAEFSFEITGIAISVPTEATGTAHESKAFIGDQAVITIQGGGLTLSATSTNTAEAGKRVIAPVAGVNVVASETSADAGGATRAYIGQDASITADTLAATATASNAATAEMEWDVGVSVVDVRVDETNANTSHTTEAFAGNGAGITIRRGALALSAISTNTAEVTKTGVGVLEGVTITVMTPTAQVGGTTRTYIDTSAVVSAGTGVRLSARSDNTATAITQSGGFSIVGVDDSDPTARTNHTIETLVKPGASVAAPGGGITLEAISDSHAVSGVVSAGIGLVTRVSNLDAKAVAEGTTHAGFLGNTGSEGEPGAASVNILAQASDTAAGEAESAGGGIVDVTDCDVQAEASPTVWAQAGGTIRASGDVAIQAISTTDADAASRGRSGGLVDISTLHADAETDPTVTAEIVPGAVIAAGGTLTISALYGQAPPTFSDGTFNAASDVNLFSNEITFIAADGSPLAHGLLTGDTVVYDALGNPDVVDGLGDARTYNVIVTGTNALKLGPTFASFDAQNTPYIDPDADTIRFATGHNLQDGDRVIYAPTAGSAIVGGLTNGGAYLVKRIDGLRIKLVDPLAVPPAPQPFNGTNISGNTITMSAGHGFQDGQAVTYRAPAATQFGPPAVDDAADTIQLYEGHGLAAGDEVIYTSDGVALNGLTSGQRYFVIFNAAAPDRIQLAATYAEAVGDGVAITPLPISASTAPADQNDIHELRRPSEQAIGGLIDGRTYYVRRISATSFTLADSGGSTVSLNPTDPVTGATLTGTSTLGTEGIDLMAPGTGRHELVLDLTGAGGGTQQLKGVGGARALASAPSGDNVVTAAASSEGGGLVRSGSANTSVTSKPTVGATVGTGADLYASDIDIQTTAQANVSATSADRGGGLVSAGDADAAITMDTTSTLTIGSEATLSAKNSVKLEADTIQKAWVLASSAGGGFFANAADADLAADVDYHSTVDIQDGAVVQAKSTVTADAESQLDVGVDANTDAHALGSGASTDADVDVGSSADDRASTQVSVGDGAVVQAYSVTLQAHVTWLKAYSTANAESGGAFYAHAHANAPVDIFDLVEVRLLGGAGVMGDVVHIVASHADVDLQAVSWAHADGMFGGALAVAEVLYDSEDRVVAESGSTVTARALSVDVTQSITRFDRRAGALKEGFGEGEAKEKGDFLARRTIDWNGNLTFVIGPAKLLVGADGVLVEAQNVTATVAGGIVSVHDISNDGAGAPHATFDVSTQGNVGSFEGLWAPIGEITGFGGIVSSGSCFQFIEIINQYEGDLVINNISVADPTNQPDISLNAESISLAFDVGNLAPSGDVEIAIRNQTGGIHNVLINGLIDNPIGTTIIENKHGAILSYDGLGDVIRSKVVQLTAATTIGSPVRRLEVELVRSARRKTGLGAVAGGDIWLDIQGRLRDLNLGNNDFHGDRVEAVGNVDLLFQSTVQETQPLAGTPGGVRVSLNGGASSTYLRHFRPDEDPPGPAAPLDFRIFCDTSTAHPIGGRFTFELIRGQDIIIHAADASVSGPRIDLTSNTDHGAAGHIDVLLNGHITLTEIRGDLRIATIHSTAGDVTLTVADGDLYDVATVDGATPWVIGNAVTLNASKGGIGFVTNFLEIDSAAQAPGAVNALANESIYLVEVNGNMSLGGVTSRTDDDTSLGGVVSKQNDVALKTLSGSILDGENNNRADVQGRNIDLIASGGGIGAETNDLEIYGGGVGQEENSFELIKPAPPTGQLYAIADGDIYVTEVSAAVNVLKMASDTGSVRIRTWDTARWSENVNLLVSGQAVTGEVVAQGSITAAGTATIVAGDDVNLPAGTLVQGGSAVAIRGDPVAGDGDEHIGTTIDIRGEVNAPSVTVEGGEDLDFLQIRNPAGINPGPGHTTVLHGYGADDRFFLQAIAGTTEVYGDAGADRFFISNKAAKALFTSGGVYNDDAINPVDVLTGTLANLGGLSLHTGTGNEGVRDVIYISAAGSGSPLTGAVLSNSVVGLGMTGAISYDASDGAFVFVILSPYNDTVQVKGVAANLAAYIYGGAGDDTVNAGDDNHRLVDVSGIAAFFGQAGTDTLNVYGDTLEPSLFAPEDIANLSSLAGKLTPHEGRDGVSAYLWSRFSTATQESINAYHGGSGSPTTVKQALVQDLNTIIQGGASLYDQTRFAGVILSPTTRALLEQGPVGAVLTVLNRMLIEDAYSGEIFGKTPGQLTAIGVTGLGMGRNSQVSTHNDVFGARYNLTDASYPAAIYYASRPPEGSDVITSTVEQVNVYLGASDDWFNVDSTYPSGSTQVHGGEGDDTITTGDGSDQVYLGTVPGQEDSGSLDVYRRREEVVRNAGSEADPINLYATHRAQDTWGGHRSTFTVQGGGGHDTVYLGPPEGSGFSLARFALDRVSPTSNTAKGIPVLIQGQVGEDVGYVKDSAGTAATHLALAQKTFTEHKARPTRRWP